MKQGKQVGLTVAIVWAFFAGAFVLVPRMAEAVTCNWWAQTPTQASNGVITARGGNNCDAAVYMEIQVHLQRWDGIGYSTIKSSAVKAGTWSSASTSVSYGCLYQSKYQWYRTLTHVKYGAINRVTGSREVQLRCG